MSDELKDLKARLSGLDEKLKMLLKSTEEDLALARVIQKKLVPNRLPEINGIRSVARYISSEQMSAETFDIFCSQNQRYMWVVLSFTESFGLSSILLGALNHLSARDLCNDSKTTAWDLYSNIVKNFNGAKKSSAYRLLVAQIDTHTLKLNYVSRGMPPPIGRDKVRLQSGEWIESDLIPNNAVFSDCQSSLNADRSQVFEETIGLRAGQRLFFYGSSWNRINNWQDFKRPLLLEDTPVHDDSLLGDLNYLAIKQQDHLKNTGLQADISIIGFEIDAKKIHLA